MSLYSVTVSSSLSGSLDNPAVNVFTYDVDDFIPSSEVAAELAQVVYDEIVAGAGGMKDLFVTGWTVGREVVVRAPQVPSVLAVLLVGTGGTRAGQQMPRFATWSFKQPRQRGDMRAGFKRVGVVSESDVAGDQPVAGYTATLTGFATLMSTVLALSTSGGALTATPNIVQRIKYTTEDGKTAYRLPAPGDPYVSYPARAWSFVKLTTQNSRKR